MELIKLNNNNTLKLHPTETESRTITELSSEKAIIDISSDSTAMPHVHEISSNSYMKVEVKEVMRETEEKSEVESEKTITEIPETPSSQLNVEKSASKSVSKSAPESNADEDNGAQTPEVEVLASSKEVTAESKSTPPRGV